MQPCVSPAQQESGRCPRAVSGEGAVAAALWPEGPAVPGQIPPQGGGWLTQGLRPVPSHSPVPPRRACGLPGCQQQAQALLLARVQAHGMATRHVAGAEPHPELTAHTPLQSPHWGSPHADPANGGGGWFYTGFNGGGTGVGVKPGCEGCCGAGGPWARRGWGSHQLVALLRLRPAAARGSV